MKGKGFYGLKYMKVYGNRLFRYSKAVKKSRKRSGFVIYSYFKCSAFTLVERDAKF